MRKEKEAIVVDYTIQEWIHKLFNRNKHSTLQFSYLLFLVYSEKNKSN